MPQKFLLKFSGNSLVKGESMVIFRKYRISIFSIIFILTTFFLFCSDDKITNDNQTPPPKATVKAVITDSSTTNPIQGASVLIFNATTGSVAANATTDSVGTCLLSVNADTSYYLEVSAQGYISYPDQCRKSCRCENGRLRAVYIRRMEQ